MRRVLFILMLPLFFYLFATSLRGAKESESLVRGSGSHAEVKLNVAEPRCIVPDENDSPLCRDLERQILSATARLYFRSWTPTPGEDGYEISESIAHATVKNGRYLVTHNHFETPLSLFPDLEHEDVYTLLILADWQGNGVFFAPLTDFFVKYADEETLVLGLKNPQNPQWLTDLGFHSAKYASHKETLVLPGMEIAQVDWDGRTTRIDWTVISEIQSVGNTKRILLADSVKRGASGGGIFHAGVHIANIWTLSFDRDEEERVVDLRTTAALNNADVLALE